RQVSSLKKLTQDLADLAQADAQQLKCYLSSVNPWEVVLQEVENFKPKLEQAGLEIQVEGTSSPLLLDRDRFKQIIVNLISNSIRYTETGGKIHIHTAQTPQEWTLYVDDSPFGLNDEQLSRLGERFYRVDDSRTRSTGGTGLGLALSCKIAQALGGTLIFEHSPLGGLRCVLTFKKQS
ncbi:ATP-binding protein, partial [Acinetobacter sp. A11]